MPTFREDLHLGHEVPMIGTEDINNGSVTTDKIADDAITSDKIGDGEVNTQDLADGAVTSEKIKDGEVKTADIADGSITPEKLSDRIVPEVIKPLLEPLKDKDKDLQNQIDSLQISGLALSNKFGNDPHIGISQKTLTEAINDIWYKLEEITGETLVGINLTVTPEYYIGEEGCDVNIAADTVTENGIIEYIKVFVNDELVAEGKDEHEFEFDVHISDTSEVKCLAQVLGVVYERKVTITHYSPFWVGAGSTYSSVMTMANIRNIGGNYNITFAAGQNLIIVVEDILRDRFVRADMNGVEIQFTETTQTISGSGKTYKVLTSENTYQAGTYNIDINS